MQIRAKHGPFKTGATAGFNTETPCEFCRGLLVFLPTELGEPLHPFTVNKTSRLRWTACGNNNLE